MNSLVKAVIYPAAEMFGPGCTGLRPGVIDLIKVLVRSIKLS
jgi:hypothetical protein